MMELQLKGGMHRACSEEGPKRTQGARKEAYKELQPPF